MPCWAWLDTLVQEEEAMSRQNRAHLLDTGGSPGYGNSLYKSLSHPSKLQ